MLHGIQPPPPAAPVARLSQTGEVRTQPKWAVMDVETTGLEDDAELIEFAVVHLDSDGEPEEYVERLVKPLRGMGAQEVHGIATEELAGASSFADVLDELVSWTAGRVVVGHNVNFDLSMVERGAKEAGRYWPAVSAVDTKVLARRAGYRVSTLQELVEAVELDLEVIHRALPDALVTAQVFQRLMHDVGVVDVTYS